MEMRKGFFLDSLAFFRAFRCSFLIMFLNELFSCFSIHQSDEADQVHAWWWTWLQFASIIVNISSQQFQSTFSSKGLRFSWNFSILFSIHVDSRSMYIDTFGIDYYKLVHFHEIIFSDIWQPWITSKRIASRDENFYKNWAIESHDMYIHKVNLIRSVVL